MFTYIKKILDKAVQNIMLLEDTNISKTKKKKKKKKKKVSRYGKWEGNL